MKLAIDPEADALYLRLNDAEILDSEQVASGVVLDYDTHDNWSGWKCCTFPHAAIRWIPIN